jgi:histidinol-phosphate aminotransferase
MLTPYGLEEGEWMMNLRNGLNKLKPYSVEEADWRIKVDANEMPDRRDRGLTASVQKALSGVALNRYPEIAATTLRQKLAADLGFLPENILIGNGSSELLAAICYTFGGSGRSIVFPTPSFSMYGVYTRLADCEPVPVKLTPEFTVPARELVEAAKTANASLVILCNPNNPTGTIMPLEDIEYIVTKVDCPVVVDEAYHEFFGETALTLMEKFPNLIIARTFSKAYGLAAARVGYLIADKAITAAIGKVLLPYGVNALSLAVAEALYREKQQVLAEVNSIISEREGLKNTLSTVGDLTVYPSQANFVLIKTKKAEELSALLGAKGIGVRDFSKSPGLEGCIRVTVGAAEENQEIIQTIKDFYGK